MGCTSERCEELNNKDDNDWFVIELRMICKLLNSDYEVVQYCTDIFCDFVPRKYILIKSPKEIIFCTKGKFINDKRILAGNPVDAFNQAKEFLINVSNNS